MKKYIPIGFALAIGAAAIIGYVDFSESDVTNKITASEAKALNVNSLNKVEIEYYTIINNKIRDAIDNGNQEITYYFRDLNAGKKTRINKIISDLKKDEYVITTIIHNDETISMKVEWK